MDGFEDDENIDGHKDGKTNVNGLCLKAVFDVNIQPNTATTCGPGRVGNHHGTDEQQQSKRNLPGTVGKEM
jgi:hypothetical protein